MAASDVEMHIEESAASHAPILVDTPPPSLPSASSSDAHAFNASETNILQVRKKGTAPSSVRVTAPSATELAPAGANTSLSATTSSKPKSIKPSSSTLTNGHKPRSPSPSPPPPPARPELQTIRLEIKLGGQDNYEVDIARLSKETGQRSPTPPRVVSPHRDDESDDSEPEEPKDGGKVKKKRKRVRTTSLGNETFTNTLYRRMQLKSTTIPVIHLSTTPNSRLMNGRSLHRRSSRDSMSRVDRLLCSLTSTYLP
jgi:hypothetical protein